jgi:hypothetical protein
MLSPPLIKNLLYGTEYSRHSLPFMEPVVLLRCSNEATTGLCPEFTCSHPIYSSYILILGARIAQWYSAGLRRGWSMVRVLAGAGNFSLHRVQTGSGAHPASYPMGTSDSFVGGKAAGSWSWPLTFIYCGGQECVEFYLHSPIRLHGTVLI